jgi:hypothetical protein
MRKKTDHGESRQLTMRYAGGLVKHLGLHMYSGAVSAIAELIANAWDADASNVYIEIPTGATISKDMTISIMDDGHGMNFEECDLEYLVLGRDRRKEQGELSKFKKRRVLAHKGLGKLAGFGIATLVEVETVKNGELIHFLMDYDGIERVKFGGEYHPTIISHAEKTKRKNGTKITLKQLKLQRAINEERFRTGIARKFAVLSDEFKVYINNKVLEKGETPTQFRYPEKGLGEEYIDGCGPIQWWIGFTRKPIDDDQVRGVSVIVRGKLAQDPWFFEISGGVTGQIGMQYMTGEVYADALDDKEDLVSTGRLSVLWEHPVARPLLEWGQKKVKGLLKEWADRRTEDKVKFVRETTPYFRLIERFSPAERDELKKAVRSICSIPTIEDDRAAELIGFMVNAYENEQLMSLIRELNATSANAQDEIWSIISKFDILGAIQTAQKVKGRVEIIHKFRQMIEAGVKEKPDLQDFLKKHKWLIDPRMEYLRHEKSLDTLLHDEFGIPKTKTEGARKRPDYFCLTDLSRIELIDLKRPGKAITKEELDRVRDYVFFLREWGKKTTDSRFKIVSVTGTVILSDWHKSVTAEHIESYEKSGIYVRDWKNLLQTTENLHRYVLDMLKEEVPEDDPRREGL